MDEREKKTFDFAGDVTKQIITLSIGILTLCIAFTDKLLPSSASSNVWLMFVALFLFTVSILCGILTLLKLTGNLAKNPTMKNKDGSLIYDCGTRLFSICQLSAFSLAIIFSMSFIGCSLCNKQQAKVKNEKVKSRSPQLKNNSCGKDNKTKFFNDKSNILNDNKK